MPTYANELGCADSEPANQICGQTTVGRVHTISKSAPAISNCHQNLFVSTNEEGAQAPRMFGPLCLVFAGERAIGWAMCYGKCGPNLLLQPPVEGCQAGAKAGQGEASPSHAGAIPACTAALLFHASGAASSACSNSAMPSGLWRARCLQSSLQMWFLGHLHFGWRQNGGWMPSLCLLLLVVRTGQGFPSTAAFPFLLS